MTRAARKGLRDAVSVASRDPDDKRIRKAHPWMRWETANRQGYFLKLRLILPNAVLEREMEKNRGDPAQSRVSRAISLDLSRESRGVASRASGIARGRGRGRGITAGI